GDETAIDCGGTSCPACTGNCDDGLKDNGEVGIDCGGPCSAKCPNGTDCTANTDCNSGYCIDNVCCESTCEGACVACSTLKKGSGANGTCGPIATGGDPDNECLSPDT